MEVSALAAFPCRINQQRLPLCFNGRQASEDLTNLVTFSEGITACSHQLHWTQAHVQLVRSELTGTTQVSVSFRTGLLGFLPVA